jgi:CTP synthase (UTP-ammonia lyase)
MKRREKAYVLTSLVNVVPLQCSLRGLEGSVSIEPKSRAAHLYKSQRSTEKFYCSFGIDPCYYETLHGAALQFVGHDDEGQIRIAELPNHPFFNGTLFVPQASALKGVSHPLVNGLIEAALVRTGKERESVSLRGVASG